VKQPQDIAAHNRAAGRFRRFANRASVLLGTPWAFAAAVAVVLAWAAMGPAFGFSEAWQLFINTGTTIVTFLMVFLIQNTQNRDTLAINLKLDELIRGTSEARTSLVALEDLSDEDLHRLQEQFARISDEAGDAFEAASGAVDDELEERHLAGEGAHA
jgi:low affinity Fe/Cu permease